MEKLLGLPSQASAHAGQIDQLNVAVHWLMLVLFIGWGIFFAYTLLRFRRKKNPTADYVGVKSHASSYLEVAVAVVEVVLLVGFSIPLWAARVDDFPTDDKNAVVVRVIGEQFAWNCHYPGADGIFGKASPSLVKSDNPLGLDKEDPNGKDDILTVNQLNLPINRNVIIHVSSKDVIHSFALQQMRVKQDTIPGQSIPVWFKPTKTSLQVQEEMTVEKPTVKGAVPRSMVAMETYKAQDGSVIVNKLAPVNDDVVQKLADAGIATVKIAPMTPTEITCAQLCGLGHYRMRGYYTIQTEEEYAAWLKTQAEKSTGGGESYE